jgi:hypothetical protein
MKEEVAVRVFDMKEGAAMPTREATGLCTLGPSSAPIDVLPFHTTSVKVDSREAPENLPPSENDGLKRSQYDISSWPDGEKAASLELRGSD